MAEPAAPVTNTNGATTGASAAPSSATPPTAPPAPVNPPSPPSSDAAAPAPTTAREARAALSVPQAPPTSAAIQRAALAGSPPVAPPPGAEGAPKTPAQQRAAEQPRAPDGKFANELQAATAEAAAPATPDAASATHPAGDAPTDASTTEAPAEAAVPEGFVKIDVPEGHPLAKHGRTRLVPEQDADYFRWAMGNTVRVAEVGKYADLARQWETYASGLEARVAAFKSVAERLVTNPEIAQQAAEIEQAYGPDARERYLKGFWDEAEGLARQHAQQLDQQRVAARAEKVADRFVNEALRITASRFPQWTPEQRRMALATYANRMEAQGSETPDLGEFLGMAEAMYGRAPASAEQPRVDVEAAVQRAVADAEARIRAEYEQREQTRFRRFTNPLGAVPAVAASAGGSQEAPTVAGTAQEQRRRLFAPRA